MKNLAVLICLSLICFSNTSCLAKTIAPKHKSNLDFPYMPYVPVGGMIPYLDDELPACDTTNPNSPKFVWANGVESFGNEEWVPKKLRGVRVPDMTTKFVAGGNSTPTQLWVTMPNGERLFSPDGGKNIMVSTSEKVSVKSKNTPPDNITGQSGVGLNSDLKTDRIWLPMLDPGSPAGNGMYPIKEPIVIETNQLKTAYNGHYPASEQTYKLKFWPVLCSKIAIGGVNLKNELEGSLPSMTGSNEPPINIRVNWLVRVR